MRAEQSCRSPAVLSPPAWRRRRSSSSTAIGTRRSGCGPRLLRLDSSSRVPSPRSSVLPLIDYYTADDDLVGEPGVSYLVRAGET